MNNKTDKNLKTGNSDFRSILIIGVLFFIFGFVTWLNGTLIPFLKLSCELDYTQAYLVTLAFYISYFVFAIPSSGILHLTGFKNGMALGLIVMAGGSLLFIPAALTRTFGLFLTGLFVQGAGLSILQTASNPYITILGPIESAAKRISIMGICNKTAGIISPLILGWVVLKDADEIKSKLAALTDSAVKIQILNEMSAKIILPYVIMAIVLIILSLMIRYSPLPDIDTDKNGENVITSKPSKKYVVQYPYLVLGVITLFFYVGAEVIAGDTIIPYAESQGLLLSKARIFTSLTLTSMLVGYILGIILIPKVIKQEFALSFSAVMGVCFTLAAVLIPGIVSVYFIALLGLANAIMWPAIWPLAIEGLGKLTKIASAMLIMAIAGGATLPLLYANIARLDHVGNQAAYWILIPIYLIILFYGIKGHKIGKTV